MRITTAQTVLLTVLLTTSVSACGDDGAGRHAKPPPPAAAEVKESVADPTKDDFVTLGENPKWIPLKEMFDRYKKQKIENLANPLLTNHVIFVEPPPLPERKKAGFDVPVSPLERGGFDRNRDKDKRTIAPLESYNRQLFNVAKVIKIREVSTLFRAPFCTKHEKLLRGFGFL